MLRNIAEVEHKLKEARQVVGALEQSREHISLDILKKTSYESFIIAIEGEDVGELYMVSVCQDGVKVAPIKFF